MEQAAGSISEFLISATNQGERVKVLFLCGPGNNGADALAAARQLLFYPHIEPQVLIPSGLPKPHSLLELQAAAFENLGGTILKTNEYQLDTPPNGPQIIVDGLFGVGLARPIGPPFAEVMAQVASRKIAVLAVDCPSGLICDDGSISGRFLPATWTISFIGRKRGFDLDCGPKVCGEIAIADIGVRHELADAWLTMRQ